jgi:hypothetical protein
LVGIGDRAVPLIGIDGYAFWSLADLAIILFAAAIAAWNILAYRRRRGQGGLAAATETGGNARPLPIAILTIAIANAALFLLSQDFAAAPLVLVDLWTIPEAALFIAECMLASIASNRANIMYGDSEEVGNAVEVRNA